MIVPMLRLTLLCAAKERLAALGALRALGCVHVALDVRDGEGIRRAAAQVAAAEQALRALDAAAKDGSFVFKPDAASPVAAMDFPALLAAARDPARPASAAEVNRLAELATRLNEEAFALSLALRRYAPFGEVRLRVKDAQLYCNSSRSAEVYLTVEVQAGGGIYSEGEGTLVARLSQTGYRDEPFVSCLMPQKKYEDIRLLEDENEAVRLAVRLARNLNAEEAGSGFEAGDLSPVTVARVCMESAEQDKGEEPPFTKERMAQLAKEYFAIDGFSCDDPAVYDAASGTYFFVPAQAQTYYPVEFTQTEDGLTTVSVESYRDPMSAFPQTRLECRLAKVG